MIWFSRSRALEIECRNGALHIGCERPLRVAIPSGWCATRQPGAARLHSYWIIAPPGELEDLTHKVEIATLIASDVRELANEHLRRRMPCGTPAPAVSEVQGREALFQGWTDGIAEIATWFVTLAQAGPRTAVGIVQVETTGPREGSDPVVFGARLVHGEGAGWAAACDEEIVRDMRAMPPQHAARTLDQQVPGIGIMRRIRLLRRAHGLSLEDAKALTRHAHEQ